MKWLTHGATIAAATICLAVYAGTARADDTSGSAAESATAVTPGAESVLDGFTAGTRLAAVSHRDLGATMAALAAASSAMELPAAELGNKLTVYFKVTESVTGSFDELKPLADGWKLARSRKIPLDRFLAISAEAQRVLRDGADDAMRAYLTGGEGEDSAGFTTISFLLYRHAGAVSAIESAMKSSNSVAGVIAAGESFAPNVQARTWIETIEEII